MPGNQTTTLEALGWNEGWQRAFAELGDETLVPGRVVAEHRTHFQVGTGAGEVSAEITGRLRKSAKQRSDLPGVGDFVAVRLNRGEGPAALEAILPRSSALVRKAAAERRPQLIAANVDVFLIVTGLDGDLNLQRLARYVDLVRTSRSAPVIVANKADLVANAATIISDITAAVPGVPVHAISARTSVAELECYFVGNRTVALIGSSGVGKSTLTNQLVGREAQATQEVRAFDSRGRHTTTHRQLFVRAGGGSIIDTPGMRGLELWADAEVTPPEPNFDDIDVLAAQCRFRNCRHQTEPGCAVSAAVDRGELQPERVARYGLAAR